MIIFGNFDGLQAILQQNSWSSWYKTPPMQLFNFNTLFENAPKLQYLNPYWNTNSGRVFTNELEFDSWYVNYLTTTPEAFKEFIDLMRIVYNGGSIYILCDWNNEISINMIEALIKFIVDNYGYVSNVVRTYDDIHGLIEGTFSADGIQLFDINMETYINLFGMNNLPSDPEE